MGARRISVVSCPLGSAALTGGSGSCQLCLRMFSAQTVRQSASLRGWWRQLYAPARVLSPATATATTRRSKYCPPPRKPRIQTQPPQQPRPCGRRGLRWCCCPTRSKPNRRNSRHTQTEVLPTTPKTARSKPSYRNCYDALIGVLLTTPKTAHSSPTAATAATWWSPRAVLVLLPGAF